MTSMHALHERSTGAALRGPAGRYGRAGELALPLFVITCTSLFGAADVLFLVFASLGMWWSYESKGWSLAGWANGHKEWVALAFTWVFAAKLLSIGWALDPAQALDNAFNHLHFLLWPALIAFLRRVDMRPAAAEPAVAAMMFLMAAWYLLEAAFGLGDARAGGRFEAGVRSFGMLATVLAFFVLWMLAAGSRPGKSLGARALLAAGALAGLVALYGTQARTELLGVAVGGGLILLVRLVSLGAGRIAAAAAMLGMLSVLGVGIISAQGRFSVIQHEVQAYFSGPEERVAAVQTSVGGRLEMYRMAMEGIRERPLLGWGAGIRPSHLSAYATDPEQPLPYSNFHNLFLQSLLEIGVAGSAVSLGIALFLFRQTVWVLVRQQQVELALLAGSLWFSYFWKSLANATFGYGLPNAVFVLFSAWFWVEATRQQHRGEVQSA